MQRVNLSSAILQLKALGIDNIARFDFISVSAALGCVVVCHTGVSLQLLSGCATCES